MKLSSIAVSGVCVVLFACGGTTTGGVGGGAGGGAGGGGGGGAAVMNFDTAAKITNFLDAKTLTMDGANIPTHPNGFLQDLDLGASTQCYQKVVMKIASGNFAVASDLGTMKGADGGGAPGAGKLGVCDRATKSGAVSFTSTAVLVENVKGNGECFDITVTFNGFTQEGRGSVTADGSKMTLELFFGGKAAKHRCVDGNPGASGVLVNTAAFSGDAKQVYVVTAT